MEIIYQYWLEFIAIIISLISLLYTLHVTDRFGLRSKIYEKKLEVCLELIETIKAYSFNCIIETSDNRGYAGGIYITKEMKHFKEEIVMFKDIPIYFDRDEYYNIIIKKLSAIKQSTYLDKSIVKSLEFLETTTKWIGETTPLTDFAKVTFKYNAHGALVQPINFAILGDFISNLQNVLEVSEKWINKSSSLKYRLNI